ncbi:MAG: hypothetical protein ACJAYN_000792 [Bermanella sp.]|jgi:hypothetical protein
MIRKLLGVILGAITYILGVLVIGFIKFLNLFIPWHKLPTPLALVNLLIFRNDLREHNLHDTAEIPNKPKQDVKFKSEYRYARSPDGSFNDLSDAAMGASETRFGRNFPLGKVWPETGEALMTPNPIAIADEILERKQFQPAATLNVIAAAWIQFQNHEWFNHKLYQPSDLVPDEEKYIDIDVPVGSKWPDGKMRILRTKPDDTRDQETTKDMPPTYLSEETHWWDGSQIYGSSLKTEKKLRSYKGGKLKLEEVNGEQRLPDDPQKKGVDQTGFSNNYWLGLSLLHTLFSAEHNAICDALARDYPSWDDQRIFVAAKLINGALMAKIHTVEWTPGILAHPALQIGMEANWWGLVGERLTSMLGRISSSEAVSGIPGSAVDHHGAPYYLTEEFTSVYRLHPLIPDDYDLYNLEGKKIETTDFTSIQGTSTRAVLDKHGMVNSFYSLGIANPGAIVLDNFPKSLRNFKRPDGATLDLAALDIMRDRERGVPRYNDFREMLRMPRAKSFKALTSNKSWQERLEKLYDGDVDRVDLMIGMYAEDLPAGFGFSDTAFRIFILMASRRLKSDRFFTTDFTEEVYTKTGMRWIADNGFASVVTRHHPELGPCLQNLSNPFSPWNKQPDNGQASD